MNHTCKEAENNNNAFILQTEKLKAKRGTVRSETQAMVLFIPVIILTTVQITLLLFYPPVCALLCTCSAPANNTGIAPQDTKILVLCPCSALFGNLLLNLFCSQHHLYEQWETRKVWKKLGCRKIKIKQNNSVISKYPVLNIYIQESTLICQSFISTLFF